MLIIYEDVACVLGVFMIGALLFAASAVCVMLWSAGGMARRWWRGTVIISPRAAGGIDAGTVAAIVV